MRESRHICLCNLYETRLSPIRRPTDQFFITPTIDTSCGYRPNCNLSGNNVRLGHGLQTNANAKYVFISDTG